MKTISKLSMLGVLLALAGTGLSAQQSEGFKAGVAVPWQLDSLKNYTHQSLMGLSVDGAYQGALYGGSTFYRAGLGVNLFPGKDQDGVKVSLTNVQLFGDFVLPVGAAKRLAVITGLSLNTWSKSVSAPAGGVSGTVAHPFGKVGFRAGLEYACTAKLSLSALLQVTELGTDSEFVKNGDPDFGTAKVNPSWLQLGVHYSF